MVSPMDVLVVSPPVCTPAEPPSGAFLLTAGLAAHGVDAALLDLSLVFYHRLLGAPRTVAEARTLDYFLAPPGGAYDPVAHRAAAGRLHKRLTDAIAAWPGWTVSLMDLGPPRAAHDPVRLAALLAEGGHPFEGFWDAELAPVLARHRPRRVAISLAYLSQLAGAIDLAAWLRRHGVEAVVGGSLPSSLAATGSGFAGLEAVFPHIALDDGLSLTGVSGAPPGERLLDRLTWPRLLAEVPYLSARPVVPLTLSTGCYWNRCLFCPDRDLRFAPLRTQTLEGFIASIPPDVLARRPVIHLLDSAVPPAQLRRFLPLVADERLAFYGFARPSAKLAADGLIERAADAGCLMLQLGAESGSVELLDVYEKGFAPGDAERVVQQAADAGVRTYLYMLFGLPGETDAEREQTRELLGANAAAVDFLNLSIFNLPVRSELTDRAVELGLELAPLPDDDRIRLYRSFAWDGASPRDAVRPFLRTLRADPRVRPAFLRTPRWLRAAHLAMMRLDGRRDPA